MIKQRLSLVTAMGAVNGRGQSRVADIEPSVGILTLASLVRQQIPTQVFDLDCLWKQAGGCSSRFYSSAVQAIADSDAGVVGLSSISGSYPATLRLAEMIAREVPSAKIVLGGPQASVVDVATLKAFPFVDAIVRGEAEETFPLVLDALLQGGPLDLIPGVTFRTGDTIGRNPNAPVILDLDKVPLPAFDLYPDIEGRQALPIEIGRGCPFACRFCSTNDFFRRRFRLKSTSCVIGQMQTLNARYPQVKSFELVHDMFTVDRAKVLEFCEALIEIGSPFQWSCSARTDCVDSELLALMLKAGCEGIFFGIETGSPRLQQVIDKGLDLEQSRRVLAETSRLGIRTTASLITGYPDETEVDFRNTVTFVADTLRYPFVDHQLHMLSPLAETPLTTEYRDRLYLDTNWADYSENGLEQQPEDRVLIAANPSIFPNFYAFPCSLDRAYLRQVCDFLIYGSFRFSSLLQALHLVEGDLLRVAQRWIRSNGNIPPSDFLEWGFVYDAVNFAEQEYASHNDPGLIVTGRFYRALADAATAKPPEPPEASGRLSLHPDTHILTVEGDIVAAIAFLRQGNSPPPTILDRTVTVVVRQELGKRSEISEMPDLALSILHHASQHAAVEDVIEDFQRRGIRLSALSPEIIVRKSIEHLSRQGFVRCVSDEEAA